MRLGYIGKSYRHLGAARTGLSPAADGRPSAEYDWRGLPAPYPPRPAAPHGDGPPELADVARAAELGLGVLHTVITDWSERGVDAFRRALHEHGQELVPTIGANLMLEGDALSTETAAVIDLLHRYAQLGCVTLAKLMVSPMTVNRFRSDPPLPEQLRRLVRSLPPIASAAQDAGIVLAFENHLDYRAGELLEVITAIDSPNLRFLFDTGNPFAVCEDPVDAARVAAPYTVFMHVKDVRVLPWTPLSLGYFACMYACPLGEGNVDLDAILTIMAREAPAPQSLVLALELRPTPPYLDEDHWLEDGLDYMRNRFAAHLEPSSGGSGGPAGDGR
jgi:sugar phosphate isomerase/epimerase